MENAVEFPLVSVIVPVFNDGERLQLCLAALEHQTYPKCRYEVIVVDNGSDLEQNLQSIVSQFSQAILTQELTPGSYAARNRGITLARGDAIAFTDADCIPTFNWIEKGIERLLNTPNCGLVAGRIEIFPQDAKCPTAVELFEIATAFPQEEHVANMKYGATANLFTWKSVIQSVGMFNATLKSGGDLDWGVRVHDAGYRQIYSEEALTRHPARRSLAEICKKTIRLAGGHFDLLEKGSYHFFHKDTLLFSLTQRSFLPKWLLKEIVFLVILIQDLIPPVMFVMSSWRSTKLKNWGERLQVAWVILRIRYTSAWAKIQLKSGQTSIRD